MTAAVAGAVRGRPSATSLAESLDRARRVNANLRDELRATLHEDAEVAAEVSALANRIYLAVIAEHPQLALHLAASILDAAGRLARQRGGVA